MNFKIKDLDQLSLWMFPNAQEDYFTATFLRHLFHQKISKSRATGKDGVRMDKFIERISDESEIIERKFLYEIYKFTRFKERLLLRGADREPRQISIPTVRDRLTLRSVCQLLHDKEPASKGFSPHAVVDQVIKCIAEGGGARKFVRIDVQNFFPSIVHSKLESALKASNIEPPVRRLIMSAIQTGTGRAESNLRGVPQGLSVSGALSAIYLKSLDKKLKSRFGNYFRYVDDILCVVDEGDEFTVVKSISRSLNSLGLVTHPLGSVGKTEISSLADGVDFLGYFITPESVSIRESSYKRMFANLLKVLTDFKYRKNVGRTIFRLNLKITGCIVDGKRRGWLMFFSRTEDLSQLAFLDSFVANQLARIEMPRDKRKDIVSFIKSYYEIRYNIAKTKYIPNFDVYSIEEKTSVIADYRGISVAVVNTWEVSQIEDEFSKLISAEVHELEEDIGSFS